MKKFFSVRMICINACIAALYVVLTLPFAQLAFSDLFQIRPSEALTIIPCLYPPAAIGLTIGCAISNLTSHFGILDVVFGSFITLVAAYLTGKIKNPFIAAIPPIVLNAVFVPVLMFIADQSVVYYMSVLSMLLTQSIVIYCLGIPLYYASKRLHVFPPIKQ